MNIAFAWCTLPAVRLAGDACLSRKVYAFVYVCELYAYVPLTAQHSSESAMLTEAALLDAGPPLKLSERVSRLTSLAVAPMEQLLTGLNLGVQQGLDPDPDNLVAVGTFAYGSLATPMQVSLNDII